MIKPPKIQAGQSLGIVALSSTARQLNPEFRKRAYDFITTRFGLNIVEAPNIDQIHGHAAGSIASRAESLNDFFRRTDIHAIMSFWGGFNSHQILEHLDFDLIKANPKILIGYSDTTSVLSAITERTQLVTFNGPAIISFAKPAIPELTVSCLTSLLVSGESQHRYEVSESFSDNKWWELDQMQWVRNSGPKIFQHGQVQGQIAGGNLGTLLLLAGTPYWPSLKGKILFLEEDEAENSKTIDRMFTQLRHMGVFKEIRGLVIGRFMSSVGLTTSDSLEMILSDALAGFDLPVLYDFDMGHSDPLATIPLGIEARLDTTSKSVTLLESAVC